MRAKVKPVAGVVEVGRIRVTDQRAPREPVPGKSLRRGGCGGGSGSHRERVSRAKLALGVLDYLPACLSPFLRSFVRSLPFSVRPSPSLFRARIGPSRVLLSFPRAFLSSSLRVIVLPFPSLRTILRLSCVSILFRCSRAMLSTTSHSLFSSSLSPTFSQFFLSTLLSSSRSFLSLVRSLLVLQPLATYPSTT